MKTLPCIIVDDEPLALELIKGYVEKTPFLQLKGAFKNATEALTYITDKDIKVAFLDIQMPGLSGLELAKIIDTNCIHVIFTTAFEEYAIEGYKVNAKGYLLKPFSYGEFLEIAQKAIPIDTESSNKQEKNNSEHIIIKADYKLWQIPLNDILYFEGVKDYVKIYRKSTDKILMPLMSLKSLDEKLQNQGFMRVQRSYIVNSYNITIIEKNHIIFDKQRIKVSDKYKEDFKQFIEERFS